LRDIEPQYYARVVADISVPLGYEKRWDYYDAMAKRPSEVRARLKALVQPSPAVSADPASEGEVRA
jgi:hypothetical protein